MKRVLVFGITDNPGGMESVIMNYYRNIDRSQVQMEFLCNTQVVAHEKEILQLGGVIHRIPARKDGVSVFRQALRCFFDQNGAKYSAFWFNTCSLANIEYLKEAKRVGISCRILHCHNAANGDSFLRGLLHRMNQKQALRLATDYWTCSEDANRWFFGTDHMDRYPTYRLVNNAIDAASFVMNTEVRAQYRKQLGLEGKTVIGHVGRFHFQKNQKFLIPIAAELRKRGTDAVFLLVGQGDDLGEVKQLADENGVSDRLHFLGVRSDVKELLWAMDVFVFPSVFEGLSIAILEAQAAGLPCVVSDQIPAKSQIADEVKFLPLGASPEVWADALMAAAAGTRSDNREKFAQAGFDIRQEAKKMEAFFLEK